MANMTDQAFVNKLLTAWFTSSTAFTVTPGTGGGSAFTITPPHHLRLMTVQGSNTASGTEATAGNCPGVHGAGMLAGHHVLRGRVRRAADQCQLGVVERHRHLVRHPVHRDLGQLGHPGTGTAGGLDQQYYRRGEWRYCPVRGGEHNNQREFVVEPGNLQLRQGKHGKGAVFRA